MQHGALLPYQYTPPSEISGCRVLNGIPRPTLPTQFCRGVCFCRRSFCSVVIHSTAGMHSMQLFSARMQFLFFSLQVEGWTTQQRKGASCPGRRMLHRGLWIVAANNGSSRHVLVILLKCHCTHHTDNVIQCAIMLLHIRHAHKCLYSFPISLVARNNQRTRKILRNGVYFPSMYFCCVFSRVVSKMECPVRF